MGGLLGHAAPGFVFLLFGLWWAISVFRRYHRSLQKNGSSYQASATYKMFCCKNRWLSQLEIEGTSKVVFCSIQIIAELVRAYFKEDGIQIMSNLHHSLMLSFFVLNGIMDLLVHYKFALPTKLKLNYISMGMAVGIQGFLFSFHNQDCPKLEMIAHKFIIITSVCGVISIVLDAKYNQNILIGVTKCFLISMIGVWMITVGFLLYPPGVPIDGDHGIIPKEWDDPVRVMITPMIFAVEFMVVFILIIIIGGLVGCFCNGNTQDADETHYTELKTTLLEENANGHAVVDYHDDIDIENQ